jgi:hypothetical protein
MDAVLMGPGSKIIEAPTSCSLESLSRIYPEMVDAKVEVAIKRKKRIVKVRFIKTPFLAKKPFQF